MSVQMMAEQMFFSLLPTQRRWGREVGALTGVGCRTMEHLIGHCVNRQFMPISNLEYRKNKKAVWNKIILKMQELHYYLGAWEIDLDSRFYLETLSLTTTALMI